MSFVHDLRFFMNLYLPVVSLHGDARNKSILFTIDGEDCRLNTFLSHVNSKDGTLRLSTNVYRSGLHIFSHRTKLCWTGHDAFDFQWWLPDEENQITSFAFNPAATEKDVEHFLMVASLSKPVAA